MPANTGVSQSSSAYIRGIFGECREFEGSHGNTALGLCTHHREHSSSGKFSTHAPKT